MDFYPVMIVNQGDVLLWHTLSIIFRLRGLVTLHVYLIYFQLIINSVS